MVSELVPPAARTVARAAAGAACAVLLAGALAGCDRPRADEALLVEAAPRPFEVDATNIVDGALGSHGPLEVRFTQRLDKASVGRRSVRVVRPGGRSLRHLRVWSVEETLMVAPAPGTEFPAGDLTVRLAGRPSPRGLRSTDGSLLPERTEIRFRSAPRRRLDLIGPRLVGSRPDHAPRSREGAEASPGSPIELRFSEPLSRGAVRSGEAVTVRVDGEATPARLRLSPDLTRIVVRPRSPLPPDAAVEVEVMPALLDIAGNPAAPATVRFHTKATRLLELAEDFVAADMADTAATTSAWGEPLSPGFLVARAGRVQWTPGGADRFDRDVGSRLTVRFQVVFPPGEVPGALASGLRLTFARSGPGGLRSARVQAGPTQLDVAEPTFEANRQAAELRLVASVDEFGDLEPLGRGRAAAELPFAEPVRIAPGAGLLLDVELELDAGVRLAAALDPAGLALLQDPGPLALLPAAELLVSGATPQARSGWYDSGIARPIWQTALVEMPHSRLSAPVVEYQTAPAGPDGLPAADEASEWDADLGRLPGLRFVRFRVGFPELGPPGQSPRIDRIVMPYEF